MEAWDVRPLRETIDRLRVEIAQLRASRERLVLAADADRRRIERDVHEIVRQQLVALAVNLQRTVSWVDADPPAAKELLEEMGRDVQQALDETARVAERIYPALLNSGGLAAALRSAAAGAGIKASVHVPAGANYPSDMAARIFLRCLEALEHVCADKPVTITLRDEEGAVLFEVVQAVEDDTTSAAAASPALEGAELRDRVEALGGWLTIRSERGSGISVSGSLPVSR